MDIPTGLYSLSFLPHKFKKRYAPQGELLEYTNYIIDKFNIRERTRANQTVTKLTYDEQECLWHIEMESGEPHITRFIIDTSEVLANPNTPHINVAEPFQGEKFHTAQWDHTVSCEGKNVGVIGSGCSATQVVPAIANKVNKVTVFMGTPEWILPRSDRSYSPAEQTLMNLPGVRQLNRFIIFAVQEV
ncbi:MAG: cation diffusion facilitator CzcD-associated flavoprotein CzcO, partial [Candidatus Azotimanducaceae bacterium]